MAEKISEVLEKLKDLDRVERMRVLLLILIEMIEREYFIVQRLKKEIQEYEREAARYG